MKSFTPLFIYCILILIISFHVKEIGCRLDNLISSHRSEVQFNGEVIIALQGKIIFDKSYGEVLNKESDSWAVERYNHRVSEYVQKKFCILILGDFVRYPEEINITNQEYVDDQDILIEDESYARQL